MENAYELLELRQLLIEIQRLDDFKLKTTWPMLEKKLYELYVGAFGKEQLPLKFYISALDIPDVKEMMGPDDKNLYLGALSMKIDKRTIESMFRSETLENGKCIERNGYDSFDAPGYQFFVALRQLLSREQTFFKLYLPPASCDLDTPLMKLIREMNLA